MKSEGIGYKGHVIKRERHQENAYIHWKYTVTGPLFPEPISKFNLMEIKAEINERIFKNPEWYQHYLNYRRTRRSV